VRAGVIQGAVAPTGEEMRLTEPRQSERVVRDESHRGGPLDGVFEQGHRGVDPPGEQVRRAERRRDEGRGEWNALQPREHEALLQRRNRLVEPALDHGEDAAAEEAWKRLYT
jgi:hypothetical protein